MRLNFSRYPGRLTAGLAKIGVCLVLVSGQVYAQNGEATAWSRTLERIATGVVSIKVDSTRAFDTEWNASSQATGFVVDAERGLILTNRHVVTPGPVRAEALFVNQEEVELTAVYRDPVHDFGFFRYDPEKLKYIQPTELKLVPEAVHVGREIRVVGNDAGEQLSILSGTIARLRRKAPDYGRGRYNDFNTFYMQAASGTSGGSSGSPVIDIDGQVIGLNAGGSAQAASSFFLPLDRVKSALIHLQQGQTVIRGTLATVFVHRAFDELRRLGLREQTEAAVRNRDNDQTGMLVVDQTIPDSPAAGLLQVADILVEVNGEPVTGFVPLEAVLDEHVGETVSLTIERNGESLEFELPVTDLSDITPDEYLEFGEAVVNDLSYQQARHANRSLTGVYVAKPGFVLGSAGIPRGSVIVGVGDHDIGNLDDLEKALAELADRQRVSIRFFSFDDLSTSKFRVIRMDRRWFPAARCVRDDRTGIWPCRDLSAGPPAKPVKAGSTSFIRQSDARVRKVARSLVLVNYDMPYAISGVSDRHYYGTGLIIDAERGYVVVDRNTVPEAMGDVRLTFAGSLEIPGRVVYIHPIHNLALVAYDPMLIGDTPVSSARLGTRTPEAGEKLWVIGLRGDSKLVHRVTEVASVEPVSFPLSRTMRFRDTNLETLDLVNGPEDIDGVLVDRRGHVAALWSSFNFQTGAESRQLNKGVPAEMVQELLELARDNKPLYSLEVEWRQMPLASARKLGLPDHWVELLESHDKERRQILAVARTMPGTAAGRELLPGDLLLSIEGRPVTRFREMERAIQRDVVTLEILRDGAVRNIPLDTVELDGRGVRRAVMWAGALLQAPYRDLAMQRGIEPHGVYVPYFSYGSPASRFGLFAGRRIVKVDGVVVADLDQFLELVAGKGDGESVRLTTVATNKTVDVITLKLDETYWPAYEIVFKDNDWRRILIN